MASVIEGAALAQALSEAKAFLRRDGSGDDALIERSIASATGLCEAFIGQWLLTRAGIETVPATAVWTRLSATPVHVILGVDVIGSDGAAVPLAEQEFAIDIDASGDGWVRLTRQSPGRVQVRCEAGMAAAWDGLPEPLRQGIIRLAAHLYTERDGSGAEPPAAVGALWRPWRRMRLR